MDFIKAYRQFNRRLKIGNESLMVRLSEEEFQRFLKLGAEKKIINLPLGLEKGSEKIEKAGNYADDEAGIIALYDITTEKRNQKPWLLTFPTKNEKAKQKIIVLIEAIC